MRKKIKLFWNRDKTFAILTGFALILIFLNITPHGFKWQFSSIFDRVDSIFTYLPDDSTQEKEEKYQKQKKTNHRARKEPVRLAIWKNTIEMIKTRPWLGYGVGNHKIYYPLFHTLAVTEKKFGEKNQLSNVHNDFLQVFSEIGTVGIILALFVFLSFFALTMQVLRNNRDSEFFAAIGAGTAVTGILVNSCFSFPFEMPIPPLILMIYFAVILCLSLNRGNRGVIITHKWSAIITVFLIPLYCYSLYYYYHDYKYDQNYLQVKQLEKREKWETVAYVAAQAYPLNPKRKKILSYAARGYIESGDFEKGVHALEKVIKAYPYHMNALLNLGVAHGSMEQYDKAIQYYQRALEIKPDFLKANINMAGVYMTLKQYDKALIYFKKAELKSPRNITVLYNMGISQFQLNSYDLAARSMEKAVEVNSELPLAQLNLAILYYQYLDKPEKSIPHFKKALALNPDVQNREQIKKIISKYSAYAF